MGDLYGIDEDVVFDHEAAESLALWLGYLADCLDVQASDDRDRARDGARGEWEGRYGDEFDDRLATCTGDAEALGVAARDAKDDVEELSRLAREEQDRREAARDWIADQESDSGGGGLGPIPSNPVTDRVGDLLDAGERLVFGEDGQEPPEELTREVEAPTIEVGQPETASQRDARVVGVHRTSGVVVSTCPSGPWEVASLSSGLPPGSIPSRRCCRPTSLNGPARISSHSTLGT